MDDAMRRMFEARSLAVLLALLAAAVPKVEAQAPDPDPARFDDDMAAFARSDAKNSVPDAATVFVGSSSIVRWNTAERFPHMRLLNRGFGGSHVSDVNHFIEETVLRYSPDVVVFYAGDNDTSAGKSSEQIFEDLRDFAEGVMHSNSTTQVVFISVKPSLSRWTVWPQMVATNTFLRAYAGLANEMAEAGYSADEAAGTVQSRVDASKGVIGKPSGSIIRSGLLD